LNRYFFSLVILALSTGFLSAQTFEFVENKGQWHPDVQYKGELSVGAFFLKNSGYRVVQHHSGDYSAAMEHFTRHQNHAHGEKSVQPMSAINLEGIGDGGQHEEEAPLVRSHAYEVVFEGGNANPAKQPEKPLPGYINYFLGNDPTKWKGGVKSFGTIQFSSVYPGVDVRYYSEGGFLKYDLVVQPRARVDKIVLRYDEATVSRTKSGELLVKTSVSEILERKPYAYQVVEGKRVEVDCQYLVIGNKVRFKLGNYNPDAILVIDPTLVFSTFVGSTTDNWGYTATYDGFGNAYGGGIAFGNGYPTTLGAFQRTFIGGTNTGEGTGFDMGLTKFNPTGSQRIFSTYLGGSGNEQPHSLVVDRAGNLIVAGRTTSPNFPVTSGGNIGQGGGWDITVTKFNQSGTNLIGSVKMGGTDNDGVNIKHKTQAPTGPQSLYQNYGDDARSEVLTDAAGNIYVASCTRSSDFPTSPGAFQSARRGAQDAVLLKFNPQVNLLFSTLLGGGGDDAAYVLYIEDDDNVLVAGGTASNDFPGNRSGTVGPNFEGGTADGFIARVNGNGTAVSRSVYIGTSGTDQIYGIQKDRFGFVYVMGTNTGAANSNFPVRNAPFNQPGGKQFIAKLQSDFSSYVYSTVFGPNTPNPNISPTAFLVDRCENVYVSGWGGQMGSSTTQYPNSGTSGLPVTPDAIDPTTDGKDFYFFVLERDALSQLYGTFFGQQDPPSSGTPDHVDGGTSRFDPLGVIYQGLCANCSPGQFPTTPGVVAPSKPSSATCNLAVIKIAFNLSGVAGGIKSSIEGRDGDTSACAPTRVDFRDTIGIAKTYQWNFGDGSPEVTTSEPQISHNYNNEGLYRVRLIAIDPDRCFPRDTSFVNIRVRTDRVNVNALATKLDPCEANLYRFDNLSSIIPTKPFRDTSFTWIFGDNTPPVKAGLNPVTHQFAAPGTYTVQLILTDTNYCNAPDTFSIPLRVSPNVIASFEVASPGCAPYTVTFNNTTAGGQTFLWNFGNGSTSTDINPTATFATPGNYTVTLIANDPTTCNFADTTSRVVVVLDKPRALFTFTPNPSEENIITTFNNLSDPAIRYKWLFGDGDSLITTRRDTLVRHQFPASGIYQVCLITFSDIGCSDTLCLPVEAIVSPIVDVVTAFTPNNDGVNDRAKVIGFGIIKMTFRIFNRLGQLVFESNDPAIGWDGRFKGVAQPMDVYAYTLDVELLSGEAIRKSGNITLIR
jgi:gliding motility-associated-like protein